MNSEFIDPASGDDQMDPSELMEGQMPVVSLKRVSLRPHVSQLSL